MEIRQKGHSAYRTEYHIVWIPKYRRRILNPGLSGYLRKLFLKGVTKSTRMWNSWIQYANRSHPPGDDIPPKYKVSEVISRIKAKTASQLRKRFPGYPRSIGKRISSDHPVTLSLL